MRNLYDVISKMIVEIPETETSLLLSLDDIQDSLKYAAPELHGMWWRVCADTMNEATDEQPNDWQLRTMKIFSGEDGVNEN